MQSYFLTLALLLNGHIPEQHFKNTVIAFYFVSLIQSMWLHCVGRDRDKFKTKHGIKSSSFLKREAFLFESALFKEDTLKNI